MVRAVMVAMVWPVLGWVTTDPTSSPMDWAVSRLNSTEAQLAKKAAALYLNITTGFNVGDDDLRFVNCRVFMGFALVF